MFASKAGTYQSVEHNTTPDPVLEALQVYVRLALRICKYKTS
jgi:hypothetical protein